MTDAIQISNLDYQPREAVIPQRFDLLRRHLEYAGARSPFYRRMFREAGFDPADLHDATGLERLPLTTKEDLEQCHPEFLCVTEAEIADFCLTSGTTGKPVAMLQTRDDLERLATNEEISFRGAGITSRDRVLIAAAIDRCFMAGYAYLLGLSRIGATVIRGGSSNIPQLLELIRISRPTAIVGVPSLLLAAGERLRQEMGDPASIGVRTMVCIGEPVRNQDLTLSPLGSRLAQCWNSRLFGTYASTEMATAFTDCAEGAGGHIRPGLIHVEIVGDDGRSLPDGVYGEVVATPLLVTGMPLVRFRTGDISTILDAPCACGRTTARLAPIVGRKSQMLKVRGTTIYPPAISSVLQGVREVRGHYIEVTSDFDLSDRIRVVAGAPEGSVDPAQLSELISAAIRIKPEVTLVSPEEILKKTLLDNKRKPVTFFDLRNRTS